MKYHNSLMIQRAVMSVVESGMHLITCDREMQLKENIHDFLFSHCKKILNDERAVKCRFKRESRLVQPIMDAFNDDMSFIELSNILANHLQKSVEEYNRSGDLVLVEVLIDMEKAYAMLFLEYEEAIAHKINYEEDETFNVYLQTQTTMLPQKGKKIKRSAFIFTNGEIIMNEAKEKDDSGELVTFWIHDFLNARRSVGDEEHTRIIYNAMEGWMRRNIHEDVKMAFNKREFLRLQYIEQVELIPEDIVKEIIEDTSTAEKMLLALQGIGVMTDRPFQVDKKWVDKKLKKKKISTSVGITLEANADIFEDSSRYEIQFNGDGTTTMIIKNIRNLQYK